MVRPLERRLFLDHHAERPDRKRAAPGIAPAFECQSFESALGADVEVKPAGRTVRSEQGHGSVLVFEAPLDAGR